MEKEVSRIANKLVMLLRDKDFKKAQLELFSNTLLCYESTAKKSQEYISLPDILQKETLFLSKILSWQKLEISDPIITRSHFCIRMIIELTFKSNKTFKLDELIVYEVKKGKIKKQFCFYQSEPADELT